MSILTIRIEKCLSVMLDAIVIVVTTSIKSRFFNQFEILTMKISIEVIHFKY